MPSDVTCLSRYVILWLTVITSVYQPDMMPCYKVIQEKTYVLGKNRPTAE